jgi:hypothetical protein
MGCSPSKNPEYTLNYKTVIVEPIFKKGILKPSSLIIQQELNNSNFLEARLYDDNLILLLIQKKSHFYVKSRNLPNTFIYSFSE